MKLRGACWLLALALPLGAQQARNYREGRDQVRELRGEIALEAPTTVRVQAQMASIQLHRQVGPRLTYTLRLRVAAGPHAAAYLDAWPILIRRSGDVVTIETGAPVQSQPGVGLDRGQLSLELTVPDSVTKIEAATAVGDISADRLGMPMEMSTRAGDVRAGDLTGALQVVNRGGDIEIAQAGEIHARATGAIHVGRANGPVVLTTTGGDVVLRHAAGSARINSAGGGIDIEDTAGPVVAYSVGGNIRLARAAAPAQLHTGGGNIVVDSAHQIECATGSGDILLSHLLAGVEAQTDSGRVEATFAPSAHLVASELVSHRGAITVTLPSPVGADVLAQIRAAGGHQIRSDSPALALRPATGADLLQAAGALHGGGSRLRLLTTHSDITIHNP